MTARERPILFSGEMVKAILSGAKTQTRRLVERGARQTWLTTAALDKVQRFAPGKDGWWTMAVGEPSSIVHCGHAMDGGHIGGVLCPYGVPGDRLWVRETWKWSDYACGDEPQSDDHECTGHCEQKYVYYRATPRIGYRPVPDSARIRYLDESTPLTEWYESGWKSPRFMPRWASRITLEVTDVRVQRLQDISEEDAKAEGVTTMTGDDCWSDGTHRTAFEYLWGEINGWPGQPRAQATWDSNPWVWAISFKRVEEKSNAA